MTVDVDKFLAAAALAARQVGIVARRLQGQVANEGKDIGEAGSLTEFERRQMAAKTAVDEMAQDIIITALVPHVPLDTTVLDGEEDTPGKALMSATSGEYVLVLDPIDGTLQYLEGANTYAVHIGLFRAGQVVAALVYYPGQDIAYWSSGQGIKKGENFSAKGLEAGYFVTPAAQAAQPRRLFIVGVKDQLLKDKLIQAGFELVGSFRKSGAAHAMEGILRGDVGAAICQNIQVRDLMHAALLTCAGGSMHDWRGKPLEWPRAGGILPPAIISAWPLPDELRALLKTHAA